MIGEMMKFFDVTLRDGIQSRKFVPTATKVKALTSLLNAGHKNLEITSFTKLPQFTDREEFLSSIERPDGVNYYGIVYNEKSYEQLRGKPLLNGISLLTSVSENFAMRNVNRPADVLLNQVLNVLSVNSVNDCRSRVYISHAFSPVNPTFKYGEDTYLNIVSMIDCMLTRGCDDIAISDTIGEGTPRTVEIMCRMLKEQFPEHTTQNDNRFSFHFHGNPQTVLKNVDVCRQYGFLSFDVSVVDGWCPNARAKHGNLNTIDLIDHVEKSGLICPINKSDIYRVADHLESDI